MARLLTAWASSDRNEGGLGSEHSKKIRLKPHGPFRPCSGSHNASFLPISMDRSNHELTQIQEEEEGDKNHTSEECQGHVAEEMRDTTASIFENIICHEEIRE